MKKGLLFVTALSALGLGLAACGNSGGSGGGGKTYTVSITNKDSIAEIYDDDSSKSVSITISDGIITADAFRSGDLVVTSSNESALIIQGNNKLKPVAAGETTVKAIYKNKFSDEVSIRVVARPAYRIASTLTEQGEYLLISPMASGKVYASAHMATGGARFYISGSENFDEAAAAKVLVGSEPEFKYTIKLKDPNTEEWKTLGTAANNNNGWHYNLGFVGDKVPDTDISYTEAKFKLTDEKYLETVVTYDTDNKTKNLYVGTGTGKTTISLGDTTKVTPAHLYEEGDAIPATAVTVTPATATVRPGLTQQLSAALTPSDSTDEVVWASDNKQVATVDAKGLVTAVGTGTATITATARVGVFGSATITVAGEAINYGTAENPLTPEQAVALLDTFGKGNLTTQKIFVRGVVTSSTAAGNNGRNVWISNTDGSVAEYFEGYSVKNTNVTLPTEANALVGGTITMTGWGTLFNTTYEITNKNASGSYDNGEIIAFEAGEAPELTGIELNKDSASVGKGESITLTVSPVPERAELPAVTWAVVKEAGDESDFITVVDGVVSVSADATVGYSATVEASAGDFSATCVITVVESGGTEPDQKISDLASGDTVTNLKAVVMAVGSDNKNFFIDDGYAGILAYASAATTGISAGDCVTVSGTVSQYNKALQIGSAVVTKSSETAPTPTTAASLTEAKAAELFAGESTPIGGRYSLRTGVIGGSGSYLTWSYGSTLMETGAKVTANMEVGKVYDIEGYVAGKYNNQYLLFVPTSATEATVSLTGLELSSDTLSIKPGESDTLTVSALPAGAALPDELTWSSSAEAVATVVNGVVTVKSDATVGATATITVSGGGFSDTCVVTVLDSSTKVLQEVYKLDGTVTGGSSGYGEDSDIEQGGIAWKVCANTTMNPWRFGGKSITDTDRAATSQAVVSTDNIEKVEVALGDIFSGCTFNSLTLKVGTSVGASDISLITENTPAQQTTIVFTRPADADWTGRYFTIVFNVTVSGSQNKCVQMNSATFFAMK